MLLAAPRRRPPSPRIGIVVALGASLLLTASLGAQEPTSADRQRGHTMVDVIHGDLTSGYYDSTFHGLDLAAKFTAADQRIDGARSVDEIFAAIASVLLDLGDSHTLFVPPERTVRPDYGWTMAMVGDSAIVDSVVPRSDAEAQGVKRGDVVLAVNGYPPTRQSYAQLLYLYDALRPQRGLRVVMAHPGAAPRQLDLAARVVERSRIVDLTGRDGGTDFWKLVRQAENDADRKRSRYVEIGDRALVWRQRTFDLDADVAKELLSRARGKKGVVLDLRGNGGGAVRTMLAMLGDFFDRDVIVATVHGRRDSTALVARSVGDSRIAVPVVVLVDAQSASAAEIFARTFQLTGRGKVIGDRTAGAVMVSRYYQHRIGLEYSVFYAANVSTGAVVFLDGKQLEHVGVTPDELIVPLSDDLAAGRDPALARALELLNVTISPADAGAMFREP